MNEILDRINSNFDKMYEGFLKNWEDFYSNLCHGLVTTLSNIIDRSFKFPESSFFIELKAN